jgi:hypothetical protein
MGKQTAVAMTDKDEDLFLAFLHDTGDIQLFESHAPSPAQIRVTGFAPRQEGHWQYYIWNKAFAWNIEYGQVSEEAPVVERRGWYYVRNAATGPVIEYDRHNFSGSKTGRIYWSKSWTLGDPNNFYDVEAFGKWYDKIVRWIRKNGQQQNKGAYYLYFLHDALTQTSLKNDPF